MKLSYSYAQELQALSASVRVTPLKNQRLAMINWPLSEHLNISPELWEEPAQWQHQLFSQDSSWQQYAIAQKYGGHQFGQWNPQLGDGRGHLLAEITDADKQRHDLHLKGAGQTPFSRHADGRAVLRSTIREYFASEAMHHLHIPTSRALCLFTSDEPVQREQVERGAMLIRTCESHLRFGHFEYYFHSKQFDLLDALFDYTFKHHFPRLVDDDNRYQKLLEQIVGSTADLIAQWQAIGFNHGVMNTDNMSIHGITFDYGPFAFLDDFIPDYVCNHSDYTGRYAFSQQPSIGLWNLNALAQAFTRYLSVEQITTVLGAYEPRLISTYQQLIRNKFGFDKLHPSDTSEQQHVLTDLRHRWFEMLQTQQRDYTQSFRLLASAQSAPSRVIDHFVDRSTAQQWLTDYLAIIDTHQIDCSELLHVNPNVILRNYHLQQAINAAEQDDFSICEALFEAITHPFADNLQTQAFSGSPPDSGKGMALSCSS